MRQMHTNDDGYQLFELEGPDLEQPSERRQLLEMIDVAWAHDYKGTVRLDFNDAVLAKMTAGDHWTAVLVRAPDGSPVGFEVALERELWVGTHKFRVYYVSILSVSAKHRRQGLGRLVLEGINQLVFEKLGADLIVSTFHQGYSGAPAVEKTFSSIEGWGVLHFHTSSMWSLRMDKGALEAPVETLDYTDLELDGRQQLREGWSSREGTPADANTLEDPVRSSCPLGFHLSKSLAVQYLNPANPASGLRLYSFAGERSALAGWNILPMALDERRLAPIGQLQLFWTTQLEASERADVVRHLAGSLANRGCFAITGLDGLGVSEQEFKDLGFVATGDRIHFAARGPKEKLAALEGQPPPYFLDFT